MFTGDIVEYHSACYCGDGHFDDWGDTLDMIRSFDLEAIGPGRGDALVGREMVNAAIESTRDFVDSTYRPAARVVARGGTLKEAWDAVRAECDPKFPTTRSTSTACRSMSPAPLTRPAASTHHGSGPRSAMRKCGRAAGISEWRRAGGAVPPVTSAAASLLIVPWREVTGGRAP
jgi:hypothetical protein